MHRYSRKLFLVGAAFADSMPKTKLQTVVGENKENDTLSSMENPQLQEIKKTKAKPTAEYENTEQFADLQLQQAPDQLESTAWTAKGQEILPREKLLAHEADIIRKTYEEFDVRSPATLPTNHTLTGNIPKKELSWRDKVLSVSDFISGHLAHHVMLDEWNKIFDLQNLDVEIKYFIWILHIQMINRRALAIPVEKWARRREVLQEMQHSMRSSWEESCTQILGRPPLQRQKDYLRDMYLVVSVNFEEALSLGTNMNSMLSNSKQIVPSQSKENPVIEGSDLALLSFLFRFIPFQRPEDLSVYSMYRLVHYIRFHLALLDRIPDEEIAKGNFNFINPLSEVICESYQEIPLS